MDLLRDIHDDYEEALSGCLHYGPPLVRKWSGGNPVGVCQICGGVVVWG